MSKFILPDVSFWQDNPNTPKGIDFNKMKTQTSSVIIRAGQNLWQDNEFDISWKNAKNAGMYRGSYWFYDSRANPKRQAEKWVEIMGNDLGELPMWCDFEDRYGGDFHGWKHWFNFMERLKQLIPNKELGVYTGYYYWQEFASGVKYFSQYPLWIAWYNPFEPLVPSIWKDWTLWQYTDNGDGNLYGVESKNIDLNYFNGTEAEFMKFFNLDSNPIPSTKETTLKVNYKNTQKIYAEI